MLNRSKIELNLALHFSLWCKILDFVDVETRISDKMVHYMFNIGTGEEGNSFSYEIYITK